MIDFFLCCFVSSMTIGRYSLFDNSVFGDGLGVFCFVVIDELVCMFTSP
jgi:hypothetical protein